MSELVADERNRQKEKGWTAEHDDTHKNGELAKAGYCYLVAALRDDRDHAIPPTGWPFETKSWNPSDYLRNLVKCASLIVAEIERVERTNDPHHP